MEERFESKNVQMQSLHSCCYGMLPPIQYLQRRRQPSKTRLWVSESFMQVKPVFKIHAYKFLCFTLVTSCNIVKPLYSHL